MRKIVLAAAFGLLSHAAFAQTLTDTYGRAVTVTGNIYSVPGVAITAPNSTAALATLSGMAPAGWVFPTVIPTTIAPEDFINRFTAAEQQAIVTATQTNWQLQLWMNKLTAAASVDVTDPRTTAGMLALVSAGLLTSLRSTQVLNLAVTSP